MRIDEYHGWVTIRDAHGQSWGRAQASLYSDGSTLAGDITAPLWMVSLSGGVSVRFDDGSDGTLRVREIRAMDGPVATVHVEVDLRGDGGPPARIDQGGEPAGTTTSTSSRT